MPRQFTLLIPSLTGGGAELVMVRMAEHWVACGDTVTLITLSNSDSDTHQLSPAVRRVALGLQQESVGPLAAVASNVRRIRAVGKAIRASRPHAVISFVDQMNVLALLATRRRRFPVIVSERVHPAYHSMGRAWSMLRRATYRSADCIVVQTESIAATVQPWAKQVPIEVIAYGVTALTSAPLPMPQRQHTIVAAGRLVEQKGFDLLIAAFAPLASRFPQWKLEIYGEGPLRAALERQIADAGLDDRIRLGGYRTDLNAVLSQSALFVLSSRYEGFPNVLLAAMAAGAACVSFDCPSGPSEIIAPGQNGLLVPAGNVLALTAALEKLIANEALREQMGSAAQAVVSQFSYDRCFSRWEQVLASAIGNYN